MFAVSSRRMSELGRLGDEIQAARKRKRLTQFELAEQVGVSLKTISTIERGIQAPAWETLTRLGHALGLEVRLVDSSNRMLKFASGLHPDEAELLVAIGEAVLPIIRGTRRKGGSTGGT